VVVEEGEPKTFGAGLLSSFGELGNFREKADLRPLDLEKASRRPYDSTRYQDVLYVSPSFGAMTDAVSGWLKMF
jgi:phenylalanine-4-hydroxylase